MTATITVVILTHNNQSSIGRLIRSLHWCDEVLVIDDQSADRTRAIAKKLGAKVFIRPLKDNFAAQRNFGLAQVTTDWAFFVDTDEIVSPALAGEIKSIITTSTYSAYSLRRIDFFWGKKLLFGETGHLNLLRLARTNAGLWRRPVHEVWQVKPPLGELKTSLYHYPHPDLAGFITKINYYTDIEARYRRRYPTGPDPVDLQGLALLFIPAGKFMYNYFFKLGILDGLPGLVMALMMSLHSLLVRLKVYEKSLARPAYHPSTR